MPMAHQFRSWKAGAISAVVLCANRDDNLILEYMNEPEVKGIKPENFTKVSHKRLRSISRKLAAALIKAADGELGRRIHLYVQHQQKLLRYPEGLEIWCIVLEYYKTNNKAETVYALADIALIKVHNHNLENFINTWDAVLDALPVMPEIELLEHYFFKAIEHEKAVEYDIQMYDRARMNDDKTIACYEFLYTAVTKVIRYQREKGMRKALTQGLTTKGSGGAPATTPSGGGGNPSKSPQDKKSMPCRHIRAVMRRFSAAVP